MKTARRSNSVLFIVLAGLCLVLGGCALFGDRPPVIRFTATPLTGFSPLLVRFDASESYDPDGTIASYAWDFGDGGTAAVAKVDHTYTTSTDHTYTVTLTVTDDDGSSSQVTQSIEVRGGGSTGGNPPTARFTTNPQYGDSPLTVTFDASLSSTPDGQITVYGWDFGDGATASGKQITHKFTAAATTNYTVTLTVTNDHGSSATATTVITAYVNEVVPTDGPTASFAASTPIKTYSPKGPTPTPTDPALYTVTFSPAASHAAPGHHITHYLWDYDGNGFSETLTTGASVQHIYSLAGPSHTYVVTLQVIDEQGLRDTAVRNVTLTF